MASYIRSLPLWLRYVFALTCGAIIVVALVLFVHHNQQPLVESPAAGNSAEQAAEANQDHTLLEQEQAPHVVKLTAHATPLAAASKVITAYMAGQVSKGNDTRPLDGPAKCTAAGSRAGRALVHCNVVAGDVADDTSYRYPFDVAVASAAGTVTYCQVVTSPDPNVPSPPVSVRCR
jgi:hypothetical protein